MGFPEQTGETKDLLNIEENDKINDWTHDKRKEMTGMSIQELDDYVATRTKENTSYTNLGGEGLYW